MKTFYPFVLLINCVLAICDWDLDKNKWIMPGCSLSDISVTEMANSIFRIKLATGVSNDCMYLFLPLSSDSTTNQP